MPYIKKEKRGVIDEKVGELFTLLEAKGDFNYAITSLLHHYVKREGLRYDNLNDAIGIIESVKQEFYRTVVAPYEDTKRKENGPVGILDIERDVH